MKPTEIRNLSTSEIEKTLRESRQKLLDMRLRKKTGQLEKPHELRVLRKDIARLETVHTEKKKHAAATATTAAAS
jgi:large subunit ribosomal protein L29